MHFELKMARRAITKQWQWLNIHAAAAALVGSIHSIHLGVNIKMDIMKGIIDTIRKGDIGVREIMGACIGVMVDMMGVTVGWIVSSLAIGPKLGTCEGVDDGKLLMALLGAINGVILVMAEGMMKGDKDGASVILGVGLAVGDLVVLVGTCMGAEAVSDFRGVTIGHDLCTCLILVGLQFHQLHN